MLDSSRDKTMLDIGCTACSPRVGTPVKGFGMICRCLECSVQC